MGLDRPIDITTDQRKTVLALLASHLPNTTAWVYGSRVKWTSSPKSDLDLVVFATPEETGPVSNLREAFEESNLPFRVDLFVWDEVPEQFRKTIEAEHVVLVEIKDLGLPGEWKKHEVKVLIEESALEIGDGYRAKNTEFAGSGVPFARAGNIKNGFVFNDADHFPEASLYRVGDKISKPGDVVFTSKGTVGRFAFVREDTPQFVYSPQLCFWRSRDHGLIDPRFLFFWMFSREFFVQFKGVAGQTDMAEYVSLRDQRNMHLTLPPLSEQRAIAHILGTLDDKIELNRRMNETLEEMARALFKSWFVDFDPVHAKATLKHHAANLPQGESDWSVESARAYLDRMDPNIAALFPDRVVDSEPGPIPEGWDVGCFCDVVEQLRDRENPRASPDAIFHHFSIPAFDENQWPTQERGENIKSQKSRVLPGVVLLSKLNPEIERVWLVDVGATDQAVCSTEFLVLRPRPSQGTSFIYCLGCSPGFRQELGSLVTGTSKSHQRVQADAVLALPVVLFPKSISEAFESVVSVFLQTVQLNRRASRSLAALRDTLLPKLVSGELRVGVDGSGDE